MHDVLIGSWPNGVARVWIVAATKAYIELVVVSAGKERSELTEAKKMTARRDEECSHELKAKDNT